MAMQPPATPPSQQYGAIYGRYDPTYSAPVGTSHAHYANYSPPSKRALAEQSENFAKRMKTSHNVSTVDLGLKETDQVLSGLPASPDAASIAAPTTSTNAGTQVNTPATTPAPTPEESKFGPDGIEWLDIDATNAPPKSLDLKIKDNCVPQSSKTLHVAGDDFLDYDAVIEKTKSMIAKPNPRGADQGLPPKKAAPAPSAEKDGSESTATSDVDATRKQHIKEAAKKIYTSIYDNSYFWSSPQYNALLKGEVDDSWIVQRSYDVVHKVLELHEDGLLVTKWTNKVNMSSAAKPATEVKSDAEINDSYESRMTKISHALRYHKAIAWDIIKGTDTLDQFILAPKACLQTKLNYKASNSQRGEKYDENKKKAKKYDEAQKDSSN